VKNSQVRIEKEIVGRRVWSVGRGKSLINKISLAHHFKILNANRQKFFSHVTATEKEF